MEAKEAQNDDSEPVEPTQEPAEQPAEEKVEEQPKTETTTKKQDSVMKLLKQRNEARAEVESLKAQVKNTAELESRLKELEEGIAAQELEKEAQKERDLMLQQTKELKEKMIEEAKEQAQKEAQRIVVAARENIEYEKLHAMTELKNQIANLSIEIAEDLLKHELTDKVKSNEIISKRMSEINLK